MSSDRLDLIHNDQRAAPLPQSAVHELVARLSIHDVVCRVASAVVNGF